MVKYILTATFLWLVMGLSVPVYAQQSSESLNDLWLNVAENYSGIKVKQTSADAAEFNERAVKSNRLPQIKAQAQSTYGTYDGAGGAFFPQTGFFNVSGDASLYGANLSSNSFGSAVVDWEIFSFGKLRKENEAAHAVTSKKNSEKGAYILQLKKLLSERYVKVLYTKAKLSWNEKAVERLHEIRSITSGLSKAGLKPAADSLLASSAYMQALAENDKLEGNSSAALIKLAELSGVASFNFNSSLSHFAKPMVFLESRTTLIDNSHPILTTLKHQEDFQTC